MNDRAQINDIEACLTVHARSHGDDRGRECHGAEPEAMAGCRQTPMSTDSIAIHELGLILTGQIYAK